MKTVEFNTETVPSKVPIEQEPRTWPWPCTLKLVPTNVIDNDRPNAALGAQFVIKGDEDETRRIL